mmetsp:Transcript_19839/g.27696  ORF Transcript_19839/g.27696 Transcript_19839/m.27696 type:complete len:260 (+) Transcript_19839:57-836(+)|eukprot:CAMPEP_0184489876 /NCGR_PEP_ID=MMETSP0113_2-20130426/16545_1 /TAXON_ID=91329 /ORGANISM="Norrisiella sphaerica, Strain BC52" /LENGTH=259 /DNA_ID=CAMNT_0026873523 /DNA_START=92 /DNA_END=871 /DNA_ORIENTATION=+
MIHSVFLYPLGLYRKMVSQLLRRGEKEEVLGPKSLKTLAMHWKRPGRADKNTPVTSALSFNLEKHPCHFPRKAQPKQSNEFYVVVDPVAKVKLKPIRGSFDTKYRLNFSDEKVPAQPDDSADIPRIDVLMAVSQGKSSSGNAHSSKSSSKSPRTSPRRPLRIARSPRATSKSHETEAVSLDVLPIPIGNPRVPGGGLHQIQKVTRSKSQGNLLHSPTSGTRSKSLSKSLGNHRRKKSRSMGTGAYSFARNLQVIKEERN